MESLLLLYMGNETVTAAAGTERVLSNMANAFAARGYHVVVATNDAEDAKAFYPFDDKVRLLYLGMPHISEPFSIKVKRQLNHAFHFMDSPFEDYRASLSAKRLEKALAGVPVDCIVTYNHEALMVTGKLKKMGSLPEDTPIAAMTHNVIDDSWGKDARQRETMEQADVIQALLPSYALKMKKVLRHTPAIYIPNIVESVPEAKRAAPGAEKARHTIITVGRVEPVQKQTHLLVEAFARLVEKYPDWDVEIWGEEEKGNPYSRKIRARITELHMEDRIFLRGTTPHIAEMLQKADIFAFPSAFEGFSLALTEAMAAGLPAVGFRSAPSVNELITDGEDGILCADGIDAFAAGLDTLMADPALRTAYGRKAVEHMKPYCPEQVWDAWQDLFERLTQHQPIAGI